MFCIDKSAKWKSLAIEAKDGFTDKDFDGLVAIEELDDYCIESLNEENVTKTTEKTKKKNKKKLKSNEKVLKNKSKTNESIEDSNEEPIEDSNEEPIDRKKISKSMHLWQNLCIPDSILEALKQLSFFSPTPIQSMAIRVAIEDKMDILGAAETGSGKTLAFGIPLVTHIMNDKSEDNCCKLRALVLTPTRELAIQVKKHLEAITKHCNVSIGVIVGGMSVQKQERVLHKVRPDIVVATPGRLWELISDESNEHLSSHSVIDIKYLVIDEADRMAEKGHFQDLVQLLVLLKRHQTSETTGRQIFVFSATLTLTYSLPKRFKALKSNKKKNKSNKLTEKQKLNNFVEMFGMRADATKVIDLTREGIGTPNEQQLTECKMNCLAEEKDLYLYYFLALFKGRTLIFCNSKDCLRRLVNVLKVLNLNPLPLHASMPQKRRLANLEKFESKPNSLLIASDVAARGLDVANIDHVVHYQIPRTAEIYVHRSGRTARAFNKGLTLMLCEPKEEANYYKQLCSDLNKGQDLQDFPIEQSVLRSMKQRIDLAQKCDQLDHKIRKERSREDWFRTNAKKCELLTDSDVSDSDDGNDRNCGEILKLKAMKRQLDFLLKKPISRTKSLYAHLLENGSNNWTKLKGTKCALDLAEEEKQKKTKNKTKKLKTH